MQQGLRKLFSQLERKRSQVRPVKAFRPAEAVAAARPAFTTYLSFASSPVRSTLSIRSASGYCVNVDTEVVEGLFLVACLA